MYTLSQTHVSFLLRQPLITHYIENAGVLAKATRILQITEKTEVTALSEVSTVLGRFIPTEGKYVARGARPEVTEDDTPSPGDFVTPPLDLHWPVDAPKITQGPSQKSTHPWFETIHQVSLRSHPYGEYRGTRPPSYYSYK